MARRKLASEPPQSSAREPWPLTAPGPLGQNRACGTPSVTQKRQWTRECCADLTDQGGTMRTMWTRVLMACTLAWALIILTHYIFQHASYLTRFLQYATRLMGAA